MGTVSTNRSLRQSRPIFSSEFQIRQSENAGYCDDQERRGYFHIMCTICFSEDINSRLRQPSAPVISPIGEDPVNHIHVQPVSDEPGRGSTFSIRG